jgi:membrane fusion protein (multidrug efflux system)
MKLKTMAVALFAIALGAAGAAYMVWRNGAALHLDNAFVTGRVIRLVAPASGQVDMVALHRFTVLPAGELAFQVDGRVAADQVRSAELTLRAAFSEMGMDCLKLDSQAEKVKLSEHESRLAATKLADARSLLERGFISRRQVEQQEYDTQRAATSRQVEEMELHRLDFSAGQQVTGSRALAEAVGALRKALIARRQSEIRVGGDLFVYDVHVLPGQWVELGTALATVVPLDAIRVQANMLESQLKEVKLGQRAEVHVDGFARNEVLHGYVESIVPATAATFSPVQRNVSDSTWIKVGQRIPVIVRITDKLPLGRIMVGQSVDVTLQAGQVEAPAPPPAVPVATVHAAKFPADGAGWDIDREVDLRLRTMRHDVGRQLRLPGNCSFFREPPRAACRDGMACG